MHVLCKKCNATIDVAGKPRGSTQVFGAQLKRNVRVDGGRISFGPGGSISFGPGGGISFGPPLESEFVCTECGHLDQYRPEDFVE